MPVWDIDPNQNPKAPGTASFGREGATAGFSVDDGGNMTLQGNLTLVGYLAVANLIDYINVTDPRYGGAVANNTAIDNAPRIDAAFAAAAAATRPTAVYIPAGVYETKTPMAGPQAHGQMVIGDGNFASRISNAASNLFALAGTAGYLQTEWHGIGFTSRAGGGHLFVPDTTNGFSQARFHNCDFLQNNDAKSYFYHHANADFVENVFKDCTFTHTATATAPGFDLVGNGGHFNSNRWRDSRITHTGNFFAWIEETNAAAYANDNKFEGLVLEDCIGGFATILSGNGTKFDDVVFWDFTSNAGTTTKNLIRIGKSTGPGSRSTKFTQVIRRGGTLGGGLVDIILDGSGAAALNIFEECGTPSGGLSIDLGSNSTCRFRAMSTGTTLTNVPGTASADTAIATAGVGTIVSQTSGTGSPEGVVAAPPGALYQRTDGGPTTTLYAKTSGTGNTGWQALGPILGASASLDFPNTAAQTSSELTITVTGAAVGDPVALGTPAAPDANTCYTAYVSATNTVTVRFNNYSAAAVNPASGTFKVRVLAL